MAIVVNLDVMMAKRKKGLTELAGEVDITLANLSILKNNKAKAVRFSTLESICKALNCQPGDILEYVPDEEENAETYARDHVGGNGEDNTGGGM
ncbi:MAG: helix-turn-helix transcriptional regulator [Lachnospiraceae bacterium]|nr:helix-turn-helix transcriptional regulator [Lachnospiraceae bacterium]MBR1853231.1 helix-turn-helix transcriptional regulator [Lachnospiraceae bacterium]